MSLYKQWKELALQDENEEEIERFWNEYCEIEQTIYEKILEEPTTTIKGKLTDLAKEYDVDEVTFVGFIDGINTSVDPEVDLEELEENSSIELNIDLRKLYYNMLGANANWLYNLSQWDNILSEEERKEITKSYKSSKTIVKGDKVGRNEPCICGSGKKYKKCCGK